LIVFATTPATVRVLSGRLLTLATKRSFPTKVGTVYHFSQYTRLGFGRELSVRPSVRVSEREPVELLSSRRSLTPKSHTEVRTVEAWNPTRGFRVLPISLRRVSRVP